MKPLFFTILFALLLAAACAEVPFSVPSDLPARTDPLPSDPAPALPVSPRQLVGSILDGETGVPVAGATVVLPHSSASAVKSDGNGRYETFDDRSPLEIQHGIAVRIFRPGYEETWAFAPHDSGPHDFHLFRSRTIAAGEATEFPLSDDNSLCGDLEFICRPVQILAPTDGTLIIEIGNDMEVLHWISAGDRFFEAGLHPHRRRLEIPVTAGTTTIVHVLREWSEEPCGLIRLTTALVN